MEKYDRILLSARDCYLLAHLWRQMFPASPYEVIYWLTSRWARLHGSLQYLEYCTELLRGKVLIFDLCGTGDSIRQLIHRLHIRGEYLLLQSDPRRNPKRLLDGPGDIEGLNCAPHPAIEDTTAYGVPIYQNPLDVDWFKYFDDIGGKAFMGECVRRNDYSEFIDAPGSLLLDKMKIAEAMIEKHNALFEPFHDQRRKEDWQ